MNQVYAVAGVSKQSYHQYLKRELKKNKILGNLILQVDAIQSEHPGCGLEKLYKTLKPKGIGRDCFIESFPSRAVCYLTAPSQTRTSRFPAYGSS